jgi:NAD(P)H-dependent nitrite reductase small subunit
MAEHQVATTAELSEDGHVVQVGDTEIALFRCDDGTVRAVHNLCPHRGGPLAEGFAEDGVVSCPWHGWEFDLATGQAKHREDITVACYAARVEGDQVFVTVGD